MRAREDAYSKVKQVASTHTMYLNFENVVL